MAPNKDVFKIKHNNLLPEKGRILISEPFLQDMYFQRSVILLTEHNENGSMGFVLNKKTDLWVNDVVEGFDDIQRVSIYLGGPVAPDHLFFIHSLGDIIPNSVQISDDIYFDGDFESLIHYISNGNPIIGKIKFFLGYSGWSKGQLNNEINQNSWLVSNITDHDIMRADGESFWKESVKTIGGPYMTWINYPKDPILN